MTRLQSYLKGNMANNKIRLLFMSKKHLHLENDNYSFIHSKKNRKAFKSILYSLTSNTFEHQYLRKNNLLTLLQKINSTSIAIILTKYLYQ